MITENDQYGIKLACYRQEAWDRHVWMADDRQGLHKSRHARHDDFLITKPRLMSGGFTVLDAVVGHPCSLHSNKPYKLQVC